MILNTIRATRTKYKDKYGELVIACDGRNYWRKEVFPHYKAGRKKSRDSSDVDWTLLFSCLDTVREELKVQFPYKVVHTNRAEADDIIATLVKRSDGKERILIVSSDKDFLQLQKYKHVDQYSFIHKKMLRCDDPADYLLEHIMRGDKGDGIPNFLSQDDSFVIGKRQHALRSRVVEGVKRAFTPDMWEGMTEELARNFERNRMLIDLECIPEDVEKEILDTYERADTPPRANLLNYFIKNKLRTLTDAIGDF